MNIWQFILANVAIAIVAFIVGYWQSWLMHRNERRQMQAQIAALRKLQEGKE